MFIFILTFINKLMELVHPRAGILVVIAGEKKGWKIWKIYTVRPAAMILLMLQPIS